MSDDTPLSVYESACKAEGVKTANPKLHEFFSAHESFESIEEIDLSNNYVGNRGILAILAVVERCPNFRFLNISDQKLYNSDLSEDSVKGNATIDRLVAVLKVHPSATGLDISKNAIADYAGRELLSLVEMNPRICRVELNDTRVSFQIRQQIHQKCKENAGNLWNEQAEAEADTENAFGEGPQWVPAQRAQADLTTLGAGRDRRKTVRVEGIDPEKAKNYVAPVIAKSEEEMDLIVGLLNQNVLFSFLTSKELRTVASAMYKEEFNKDDCIIEFGQENCNKLYIIQTGRADIIKEGQSVFIKVEGTAVGELELMYDTPAVATVKVLTDSLVAWVLDRETYRNLVMGTAIRRRETYVSMLERVPFLESLDNYERMQVADALSSDEWIEGDYIIHFDGEGEWLYIIVEGDVKVVGRDDDGNEKDVCTFSKGDHFGELEFLNNHRCVADVIATTNVTTAKLNRRHFEMCMGPVMDVLQRNSNTEKYEYYQKVLTKKREASASPH